MGFADAFNSSITDYSQDLEKSDMKYAIHAWLKEHAVSPKRNKIIAYDLTDDMKINVKSDCIIKLGNHERKIEEFPNYINFNVCKGNFSCSKIGLKTLRGCPKTVYGSFFCNNNLLSSLEGGPTTILKKGGKSFIEHIKEIRKRYPKSSEVIIDKKAEYEPVRYDCSNNKLYVLDGAPSTTENCTFIIEDNPIIDEMLHLMTNRAFKQILYK